MMVSAAIPRWLRTARASLPYARLHGRILAAGIVMALLVVGIRIILPWSLDAVLAPLLPDSEAVHWFDRLPGPLATTTALAGLFFVLLVALGLADHRERLYFARFAIGSVHHLRTDAARSAVRLEHSNVVGANSGDLIARLIGDTARVKTGLKGFLVHVATNGAMFLGVTFVLFRIDRNLGLVFAAAGALIAITTLWGAAAIFRRASKYRIREGDLADSIHNARNGDISSVSIAETSESSGHHEAAITAIQGRTTWSAHAIFGAAVVACLLLGVRGVENGTVEIRHVVVFIMYALMMRAPMVQLARQGARTGKIFACLERVIEIIHSTTPTDEHGRQLPPLRNEIRAHNVHLRLGSMGSGKRLLGPISLSIAPGERIAVVGHAGCGKTKFAELFAGVTQPDEGDIYWDQIDWTDVPRSTQGRHVVFANAVPTWPRQSLRRYLVGDRSVSDEELTRIIRNCRGRKLFQRLTKGIDTKIASGRLSMGQRKTLACARACLAKDASLVIFDDPATGYAPAVARRLVRKLLKRTRGRAVIMTFSRPFKIKKFDRVIELRKGRVIFDGTPLAWREFKDQRRREKEIVAITPGDAPRVAS